MVNSKRTPEPMLSFSNEGSSYSTLGTKIDVPFGNSVFNSPPSDNKFGFGAFNYSHLNQRNLQILNKNKPTKNKKIKNNSMIVQKPKSNLAFNL